MCEKHARPHLTDLFPLLPGPTPCSGKRKAVLLVSMMCLCCGVKDHTKPQGQLHEHEALHLQLSVLTTSACIS